jgi:hypothetical protein
MITRLTEIQIIGKKTVFWFEIGSVNKVNSFKCWSLYVSRMEGARVIKRLGIKPKKIAWVNREEKGRVTVHLK